MIAFDTETHLITPGNLAPRPVVASFATESETWVERFLNQFDDSFAEQTIERLLSEQHVWAGANIAYDWAVMLRRAPGLEKQIFALYERGLVWDVECVAALDAVAEGRMLDGAVLGKYFQPLRKNGVDGAVTNRFSLLNCCVIYLNKFDAKANDEHRLKYGLYDYLPTELWPQGALQYPKDDARNTYDVAQAQKLCGNTHKVGLLGVSWPTFQARAAFAMHLGSVAGLRADPLKIAKLEAKANATFEADNAKFKQLGLLKPDGTKNGREIKRRVALAYGTDAASKCSLCKGTGKVPSKKTRGSVNCKRCDSTGLVISDATPLTEAGAVATDRDTLEDTGDEVLEAWAEAGKSDKLRDTYLPWLKQGVDAPLNVRANALVASGRCSYDGLVQLIPPAARECLVAPEGRLFCSVDYPSLELCTLAQVCKWVLGQSRMLDVINASGDPGALHTEFGARMAGAVDIGAFAKAASDKSSKEYKYRFMAKAANFGFPGGMGAPKLVLAKRKEGLRFCVASGQRTVCLPGALEWRGKRLDKPTCLACIDVADQLRQDWFAAWPEIKPYFDWVGNLPGVRDGYGSLETPGTGYVRGGLRFTSAANHSFQHLGACAAKHALWLVTQEAYCDESSPLFGTRPLVLVHDELFCDTPEEKALEAGFRIAELMRQSLQIFCPDVKVPLPEPAFMRHWYKQASLIRDAQGRPTAIPWEPKQ